METYGNLAESGDVAGHSQDTRRTLAGHSYDSDLENCEFAEQKIGAGEGNRTLVSVGTAKIIENGRKMRDLSATRGPSV
jgi:hypothetical protein